MAPFSHIDPKKITDNPFSLIGDEWMLITAATPDKCNTMTASWGGVGILWNKPVAFAFVRPQRHTFSLLEKAETYSLSFLPEQYRDALRYCGAHSGRDGDKFAATGLSVITEDGTPCIEQARLVLVCRKCYTTDFTADRFCDSSLLSHYKANDFHRQYIGEIIDVLKA